MTTRTALLAPGLLDRTRGDSTWPCVSLQEPVTTQGFDRSEDRVRLKNLVNEARGRLLDRSADPALLEGLDELDVRSLSRERRSRGLLVFRSPALAEQALLPHHVEPRAVVHVLEDAQMPTDPPVAAIWRDPHGGGAPTEENPSGDRGRLS